MSNKALVLQDGKNVTVAGTVNGQVLTWTSADEWAPGPSVGGSGGGGELFYLNKLTNPDSPVTNIPTGASGTTVKELGTSANGTGSTVSSTSNVPVSPSAPEIIAGFVTDLSVPNATEIPAGLWEFNVWAEATGNTTNQSFIQAKVYKYNGVNAPTAIATSANVYLYDPSDVTQYTLSVLIPGGVTLLATDRIYVEILGGSTTTNRQITLSFGNSTPSHVHTTLFIPINLGTDVTGTLSVANGGTGASTLTGYVKASGASAFTASAAIPVAEVTGAAPLASPTFSGTPSLPTGTTGVTQSAGNNTTALATTAFVTTALSGAGSVTSLTGTANQVIASASTGAVTLSLPQSISTSSSVSFGSVTVSGTGNITVGGTGYLILTNQTASLPLVVQAGKSVIAQAINLGSVQVTGTLDVPNGGTGATTLTGYVKGSGASALTASATIPVADLNGQVALAKGGTAANLTAVNGGAVYSTASALAITAAGTSGQFLKSNGAAAPTWADVTVSSQPYDISGEVVGTPTTGATVLRFVAIRAFTLSSATSARFACTTGPTSTATFTINHVTGGVTTSKGTVTIATSATSGSGTLTSTSVAAGDYITVVATTPAAITDVWFTLPGTV